MACQLGSCWQLAVSVVRSWPGWIGSQAKIEIRCARVYWCGHFKFTCCSLTTHPWICCAMLNADFRCVLHAVSCKVHANIIVTMYLKWSFMQILTYSAPLTNNNMLLLYWNSSQQQPDKYVNSTHTIDCQPLQRTNPCIASNCVCLCVLFLCLILRRISRQQAICFYLFHIVLFINSSTKNILLLACAFDILNSLLLILLFMMRMH